MINNGKTAKLTTKSSIAFLGTRFSLHSSFIRTSELKFELAVLNLHSNILSVSDVIC